jgi:hypothetical protein
MRMGEFPLCRFVSFVVQKWVLVLAAAFLQLIHHTLQIRIAGAKASGEPVAAALHHCLAIGQHFKLSGFSRCHHGVNSQPLFNQGHETRDLGFVAPSSRAGKYLNVHCVLLGCWFLRLLLISVISVNHW